jgi:formate dehydrogenase iron-sulfur subunit
MTATVKPRGLLIDITLCTGCKSCVKACMQKQGFKGDPDQVKELSATSYTVVRETKDEQYVRQMCRHCVQPSCASVCPVAALRKTDLGPVTYDVSRCIGCRYCMVACPMNVPRYEWDSPTPAVRKCDMCYDRQAEGKPTACSEACPNEATITGDRDELVREAHARIAKSPGDYEDHVYGEFELGGTSVLFLAPKDLAMQLFPKGLGTEPLPNLTGKVLHALPGVVAGGAAAMFAFWWITRRRDEVAAVEGARRRRHAQGEGREVRDAR